LNANITNNYILLNNHYFWNYLFMHII
jgi:hypothetical protein